MSQVVRGYWKDTEQALIEPTHNSVYSMYRAVDGTISIKQGCGDVQGGLISPTASRLYCDKMMDDAFDRDGLALDWFALYSWELVSTESVNMQHA